MRVARFTAGVVALAVAVGMAAVATPGPPAAAEPDRSGSREPQNVVTYRPPVDAPISDRFRAPPTPYAAGNRGIDYATTPGAPVHASAAGEVVFAGQVGGADHVVVLHPDGVRTTYAFLASASVARGQHVDQGDVVGVAGDELHFGARVGDEYVDPMQLLDASATSPRPRARLLPDRAGEPGSVDEERAGLVRSLQGLATTAGHAVASGASGLAWLATSRARRRLDEQLAQLRLAAHYAEAIGFGTAPYLAIAALEWSAEQQGCTPPDVAAPAPTGARRIVVLVGGLGSATGRAAVLDVDTATLGYAAGDVSQFSYRDDGAYGPADTLGDIGAAGQRLARYVRTIEASAPGVPIDVIAHSQGGLVARAALAAGLDGVATLVTLATPHRGADLATAAAALSTSLPGRLALGAAGYAGSIDPRATSVQQMAETSAFLAQLNDTPLPATTRVVSIAAERDVVVPSVRSHLDGAANVVVDPQPGTLLTAEHAALPGSPQATREIALAVAGLGPTCRTLAERLRQETVARNDALTEDLVGASLGAAGWWAGRTVPLGGAGSLSRP